MSTEHVNLLACPQCSGKLSTATDGLRCAACDLMFPIRDGVVSFSKSAFYWGDMRIPQESMSQLAEVAQRDGWEKAVALANANLNAEAFADFMHYANDAGRCGWKLLVDLPKDGVALDIGCGWGTLSLSLAENFRLVMAMDLTREKGIITSARARQNGLNNVLCLHGGDTPHLPLASGSVDLIVLNGVLEWVPKGCTGDPREVQKAFLREVHRVLRPTGQLYIGIENRAGYPYFLGRLEEHCGLKYVSLLPRPLANIYARAKKGAPYQTYTYTVIAFRKLLRAAGFANMKAYSPFPDYREFDTLIDLDDRRQVAQALHSRSLKGKLIFALVKLTGSFKYVSPSYGLIASKNAPAKGFVAQLLATLDSKSSGNGSQPSRVNTIHITKTETALVFVQRGDAQHTVRLPLSRPAAVRVHALADNLRALAGDERTAAFRHWLPQVTGEGRVENQPYLAHTHFPGSCESVEGKDLAFAERLTEEAVNALAVMQTGNRLQTLSAVVKDISDKAEATLQALGVGDEQQVAFCQLRKNLEQAAEGELPVVVAHGDYGLPNIVFNPDDWKVRGIIDWDVTNLNGSPLMDWLQLMSDFEAQAHGKKKFWGAYRHLLEQMAKPSFEQRMLDRYLTAVPLSRAALRSLVLLFPMHHIASFRHLEKGTTQNKTRLCNEYFADLSHATALVEQIASR